jgi:membrane protein YdbS with pleckstrin-like domain
MVRFQETDVWWGSYAGRTMLPSFVLCSLATATLVWAAFAIWEEGLGYDPARYAFYGLMGGLWLWQFIRWGYRIIAYNYRLTTRRLFCMRGFLYSRDPAVELDRVATVTVEQSPLERLLGCGTIIILLEGAAEAPVVLPGVRNPQSIAEEIRNHARTAREENVVAARV